MIEFGSSRPIVRAFAPGRTEIAGNHTDHQGGRVIAAAVSQGIAVRAQGRADRRIHVESAGFEPIVLDLSEDDFVRPRDDEEGTSAALVRGVVAGLRMRDLPVCGFNAQVESTLPAGGGLSSSAAFELELAAAVELLFGGGAPARPLRLARIAQAAERDYFGKPCGLMDQLASAAGGLVEMDFARPDAPMVDPIAFGFGGAGFDVCLVNAHADHSRFTREYAQVPLDMTAVANLFGKKMLSEVPAGEFMENLGRVRRELGDRCALRAMHYYNETNLVAIRAAALRAGDMRTFLSATRRSAASSAQYLQNVSVFGDRDQPAMVALALADGVLGDAGAARIHGGGFGGSIQAFVPRAATRDFCQAMDGFLGEGSARPLAFSDKGAHAEWE